ncbi:PTI1-like tyrosine-protein kinase [Iris pallida]|uniref:PTI1-like tyrosine-protein kinase n=1 Tax=Iris pallida TaxID=29817 RepID=A0AAX6HAB0_IRIPA|nr:PTI1-like tyrosine-protein kinase [Iris pallida]
MLGKASEGCDVYSFGILLLELASGRRPIERVTRRLKRTITEWALPLARERRLEEVADPKLRGDYVRAEMRRVVTVAMASAQRAPERRPTMLEVVALLKGEDDGKLLELENSEMFREEAAAFSGADGS